MTTMTSEMQDLKTPGTRASDGTTRYDAEYLEVEAIRR